LLAGGTDWALCTDRSLFTLLTLEAAKALRAGGTDLALLAPEAARASRTDRAALALGALRSSRADRASRADGADIAPFSLLPLLSREPTEAL